MRGIFSADAPSSQVTIAWVKLTKLASIGDTTENYMSVIRSFKAVCSESSKETIICTFLIILIFYVVNRTQSTDFQECLVEKSRRLI